MGQYKRTSKPVARKVLDRERETGYRVVTCPGGAYKRGAEFSRNDFLTSLAGLVWPDGMEVEDIADRERYVVHGYSLLRLEEQA